MVDIESRIAASMAVFYASYRGTAPKTVSMPGLWSVERIIELGMGVEVWLSEHGFKPQETEKWEALRQMLRRADPVTTHTDLSSWQPGKLRDEIDMSAQLGASVLVVHCNTLGLEDAEPPGAEETRGICAFVRDHGLILALENSGRIGIGTLERALDLVGSNPAETGLGICVDTGHANRSCARDGITPAAFIEKLKDVTVEVHVNDNEGVADLHLPPGEGTIDWHVTLSAMRLLPDHAVVCIEIAAPGDPAVTLGNTRQFLMSGWPDL